MTTLLKWNRIKSMHRGIHRFENEFPSTVDSRPGSGQFHDLLHIMLNHIGGKHE